MSYRSLPISGRTIMVKSERAEDEQLVLDNGEHIIVTGANGKVYVGCVTLTTKAAYTLVQQIQKVLNLTTITTTKEK